MPPRMPTSPAPVAPVQAATAPGPGDHRLRDAGTPAGAGAGADGDDPASRSIAIRSGAHVQRLCPEDGRAGGRDPRPRRRKFNVGSPQAAGRNPVRQDGVQGGKRGKTGVFHAGGRAGGPRREGHLLPARVLDWRQLSKLKSTYTDALQDHINPETGRVHTSYSIAGANTGRLASTDPNLQNIPSAPRRAAASARPSSPSRARCWSRSTIPRSSCASSPISPGSSAETGLQATGSTSTP
jgi:hypothetical protein